MLNDDKKKGDVEQKLKEYRLELEKKVMVEDFKMPVQSNGASMIHNTALSPNEN